MEGRWDTGRTEAFSDGVFAIAITLLVLDINVPESDFADLWHGIAHQWPSYLGYVTSFATIGGLWLSHHGIFRRIQFADTRVTRLNLLLMMVVSFLPFPTRLVSEAIRDPQAETAAVIFYGTTLLAISVITWALWGTVARDRELLRPEVTNGGGGDDPPAVRPQHRRLSGRHRGRGARAAGRCVRSWRSRVACPGPRMPPSADASRHRRPTTIA